MLHTGVYGFFSLLLHHLQLFIGIFILKVFIEEDVVGNAWKADIFLMLTRVFRRVMDLGFDRRFLLFNFLNFFLNTVGAFSISTNSISLKNTINITLDDRHHK